MYLYWKMICRLSESQRQPGVLSLTWQSHRDSSCGIFPIWSHFLTSVILSENSRRDSAEDGTL